MISAHIVDSLLKGLHDYKVELIAHTNITLATRIRMTIGSVFTVPGAPWASVVRRDALENSTEAKITSGHIAGGSLTGKVAPKVTTLIRAKHLRTAVTEERYCLG